MPGCTRERCFFLGSCQDMLPVIRWELGRVTKPLSNNRCYLYREVVERHFPKDDFSQDPFQWVISALMCYHHLGSWETAWFNWMPVNEGRFLHVCPGLILDSVKWECCHRISNLKVPVHIMRKNMAQNNILNFKFASPNLNFILLFRVPQFALN